VLKKDKKYFTFFIVRLEIVCMFAAANENSKNDQRDFGKA
jgi:hypothetical protein